MRAVERRRTRGLTKPRPDGASQLIPLFGRRGRGMKLPELATVIGWSLLAGTASSCSTHQKLGLAHHLSIMTGPTATNCGIYRIPPVLPHKLSGDQAQVVSACISDSHAKREAFWFSVEGPGIDSYLATG